MDDRADCELGRLITKRYDTRDGDALLEPTYAASVRRYNAHRQRTLAQLWLEYHVARRRTHRHTFALLDAHHEAEIQRYSEMLELDGPEPNGHKEKSA